MASSSSSKEHLTCSVCLTIFTDPVTLLCGHSFCRECITRCLSSHHTCPQCREPVRTQPPNLPTTHILKSLAEKAREAKRPKTSSGSDREAAEGLCPEHEEKLKLFCVTDQRLACIICRDAEAHGGHHFKPVKEAAASLRTELETFVHHVSDDIHVVQSLVHTQKREVRKTKARSQQLMTQISSQFEEIHLFLRKTEEEIKNELKHKEEASVREMSDMVNTIETALTESRQLEDKVNSALKITDPERFLKVCSESDGMMAAKSLFRPTGKNLKVVNTSLSLGPYESHLQYFLWKKMFQVIQPRAELLSFTRKSPAEYQQPQWYEMEYTRSFGTGFSNSAYHPVSVPREEYTCEVRTDQLTSGKHFWEIDVRQKNYWELKIKNHLLKCTNNKYTVSHQKTSKGLTFESRPEKIGIYLDCSSNELFFYDTDTMKPFHSGVWI